MFGFRVTRMEIVLETLVYLPFIHLMELVASESFLAKPYVCI